MDGISDISDVFTFFIKSGILFGNTFTKAITDGDNFEYKLISLLNDAIDIIPEYFQVAPINSAIFF